MKNQKHLGILCILSAAFFFACMSAFVRASGDLPSIEKSFFRNAVAFFFALAMVKRQRLAFSVPRNCIGALFLRSVCGTVGILCNFYAVDHLLLSDATMLNKLSPFFAILFSYFLLRERISLFQFGCVALAFTGSLLIVKPGFSGVPAGPALIGLLGGMGAGAAYTFVRILGKKSFPGPLTVLYFSAFSCLVTLPYILLNFTPMTGKQFLCLILAGLSAAGGQFSITAAYTFAPAREISVYDYTQVLFSALIGYFFFSQTPDLLSVLGYITICGASVIMFLHQRRQTETAPQK